MKLKPQHGFNELEHEIIFKVTASNTTCEYDKDMDAWITVNITNTQPTGTLHINKQVEIVDEEKGYTYVAEEIDYSKIKFKLIASENIMDFSDGSYYYLKDEVVGIYSVDDDGTLIIEGLPMGAYRLQEISTLDGYVLDEEIYTVEFIQTDTTTKVYEYTLDLENLMTTIEISKVNINGELIENCILELYKECYDENGENYLELVDTWNTSDKAHTVKGLSVDCKYILKEIEVAENYVLAKDIDFTVNNTDIQKIEMIDKQVAITKVNVEGEKVEGAYLQVINRNGRIVDEWISNRTFHYAKGLKEGETYTLVELYAPKGYVKAKSIDFTVNYNKQTQEIILIDKIVEMSKKDINGNELEGATMVVTHTKTKNIVDKWISSKEPHRIQGLIEGETYILHEEIAVDGYVKATNIEFTVSSDKFTQTLEMIDKIVLISKTDLITSEELPGAELEVKDEEGNIIDKWISSDKPHQVVGLEEGKTYTLTEVTCPYRI